MFPAWPGGVIERCVAGTDALRDALLAELRQRIGDRRPAALPDDFDIIQFTRAKVEPVVHGLFPKREQDAVLGLLEKSVVFLTPDNIERVIVDKNDPGTMWDLANLYLLSVDVELLGPNAPTIVGANVDTTCYVSAQYFAEDDPFADFVVHEVAHVFHNCKRKLIGLPHTRTREWLLSIDFNKRETFAYTCETYGRLLEKSNGRAERRRLFEVLKAGLVLEDRRFDPDEYLNILAEVWRPVTGGSESSRGAHRAPEDPTRPVRPVCSVPPVPKQLPRGSLQPVRIASRLPSCREAFRLNMFRVVIVLIRGAVAERTELAAENLALRQQLAVLKRTAKRPSLSCRDRIFWVWLSKLWPNWRSVLVIVELDTVVRWHRLGFRLYWRWKSRRGKPGRPKVAPEIRELIRRMPVENPLWGSPRIQSELTLRGHDVSKATIDKYRVRHRRPPSQTWRTFLNNHAKGIVAIDFFTVPTATFRILYCLVMLHHDRRTVVHFNVTANPTARWTAQQVIEAFPFNHETPRFLLRDRDGIYGQTFRDRVKNMGIEEVITAARSPWQTPYVERLIGSIRRECLDHLIILNERHLRRILSDYFTYHQRSRPHLALDRNAPVPRRVEPPSEGRVVAIQQVGGLHHRYRRAA